jgi:hypothetical protein
MTDKSSFIPQEWKLLLESVMMASLSVTAAEPSGLWGLLKESFAGGTELAKAEIDPGANALIKAVVADFGTTDGRSIARDGLKEKLKGSKPADIKAKCVDTHGKSVHWLIPRRRVMQQRSRVGYDRSANMLPRQRPRAVFWGWAVSQ